MEMVTLAEMETFLTLSGWVKNPHKRYMTLNAWTMPGTTTQFFLQRAYKIAIGQESPHCGPGRATRASRSSI